ncbi:hypothetical protein H9P43_004995 [Blastocladiella emersonii ATCC 22665]|nr:hypothetical protein H9P43_004995 [Blastocladiella emersonii ATCC 22665]
MMTAPATTPPASEHTLQAPAILAHVLAPVDAIQGHVLIGAHTLAPSSQDDEEDGSGGCDDEDGESVPSASTRRLPRGAWTLVAKRAADPPDVHSCCVDSSMRSHDHQHDDDDEGEHDHDHETDDAEADEEEQPRKSPLDFYDVTLSDASDAQWTVPSLLKAPSDAIDLTLDYPDMVVMPPARAAAAAGRDPVFAFTTTRMLVGPAAAPLLDRYFPRLAAVLERRPELECVVCIGNLETNVPPDASVAVHHHQRPPVKRQRAPRPARDPLPGEGILTADMDSDFADAD